MDLPRSTPIQGYPGEVNTELEIIPLFATPLVTFDVPDATALNVDLRNVVEQREKSHPSTQVTKPQVHWEVPPAYPASANCLLKSISAVNVRFAFGSGALRGTDLDLRSLAAGMASCPGAWAGPWSR